MSLSPTTCDIDLDSIDETLFWLGNNASRPSRSRLYQALTQTWFRPQTYKCVMCLKKFKTQVSLIKHKCQKKLSCDICAMTFHQEFELKYHKMTHKPHQCEICGRRFRLKSSLTHHAKTHTEEITFIEEQNSNLIDADLQKYIQL